MDLNSLTAMGRSWVGNVRLKVEGVLHEMDSIMKQDKFQIANQEELTTSELAKYHSGQDTRGFLSPKISTRSEDRSILGIDIGTTHFERSHIDIDTDSTSICFGSSHANFEDMPLEVDEANGNDTNGPHNFEQLVVEPWDPWKENFDDESNGPGDMHQLDNPASAETGEHQLEKICQVNTIDHVNCETGEEAGASQLPENPLEGEESEMDVDMQHFGEETINVMGSSVSGVTSIPSSAKELFDSSESLQSLDDGYECALEVGSNNGGAGSEFVDKMTSKANTLRRSSDPTVGKNKIPSVDSNKNLKKPKGGINDHSVPGFGVDTQSTELFACCGKLLKRLMKHKFGWVFDKPVDVEGLELHDYFTIVKHPMDLGTVRTRLKKNWYKSPREFAEDVRLTFRNAMLYYPEGQDVHFMADSLLKMLEENWKTLEKDRHLEFKSYIMVEQTPISGPPERGLEQSEVMTLPVESVVNPESLGHAGRSTVPKKPKLKDSQKRDMTYEGEKQNLSDDLQNLPSEKLENVVQIIMKRNPQLCQQKEEIEVDIDSVDVDTLWELNQFVANDKKSLSKVKSKAEARHGLPLNKCQRAGVHRSSYPPLAEIIDNSGESPRESSPVRLYHAEAGDPPGLLLLSHAPSNIVNDSGNVLYGREMETIDLTDEAEELEGNVDTLSNNEICSLSLRVQNIRSLKKKLRDAFNPNKRIAKEYERLGIWYGDIDLKLGKETRHLPPSSSILPSKDQELSESEWVVL